MPLTREPLQNQKETPKKTPKPIVLDETMLPDSLKHVEALLRDNL